MLHLTRNNTRIDSTGSILVITIVIMGIFGVLFSSLADYLLTHYRYLKTRQASEYALQIAEAGVEYYRWRLAHFPDNLTDGTGLPGPYVHTYEDPESGPIGQFSLYIGGEVLCGKTQVIIATSTGWTLAHPEITRTIVVQMARPTVADYSYIVNAHVYAGASRIITGPYHSNGVVRMDGQNRSAVTSKRDTETCSDVGLGGCPASNIVNGVYGNGTSTQWWRWAQPDIPFNNFAVYLDDMEPLALSQGIYLGKVSNESTMFGYYLELRDNKSVDIYHVTSIWATTTTSLQTGTTTVSVINPELGATTSAYRTFVRNEPLPPSCPLIYVSDRTWLSGTTSGRVTVVANATTSASVDLFLQNNVTYSTTTGADGLVVLAERHLLIPLYVPNNMKLSGVFFAQKGAYGRAYYPNLGNPHNNYRQRASLTTTGTVVSNWRTGTAWIGGTPDPQGFVTRYDSYDRMLAQSPPPLTPRTSSDFRYISWKEVR